MRATQVGDSVRFLKQVLPIQPFSERIVARPQKLIKTQSFLLKSLLGINHLVRLSLQDSLMVLGVISRFKTLPSIAYPAELNLCLHGV